jgi:hypothetical protein
MLKLLTPPAKLTTSRGFCSSMDHAAAILCTEVLMDVWQPKRERERERERSIMQGYQEHINCKKTLSNQSQDPL